MLFKMPSRKNNNSNKQDISVFVNEIQESAFPLKSKEGKYRETFSPKFEILIKILIKEA